MSALTLKIIACVVMLLDHIGFVLNCMPFRIIGRIAFPIFLYLICNGYKHTSSPMRYAFRLGIFALVSQVPFSLFCYNSLWSSNGNVFFTLLMALLCIWAADVMRRRRVLKWFCLVPAVVVFFLYELDIFQADYGARAILAALVFYWFDGKKTWMTVGYLVSVLYETFFSFIWAFIGRLADPFMVVNQWDLIQLFSVFALPLIFRYNGQKGSSRSKILQYGFYIFYPLHLLLLWMI